MILGMSVGAFTTLHVVISLVAILLGLVVLWTMLGNRYLRGLTALFLATTVATSVTGFLFPSTSIGPPHIIGAISLIVLAVALVALYAQRLRGRWRTAYVATALLALYLNVFVGVVQAFQKIGPLHVLAPNGSEPPFAVAQAAVLALFVWLGYRSVKRFRPFA